MGKGTPSPSRPFGISFEGVESLTKQSFKDECDINRIMSRYQQTGQLPNVRERMAQFLDVSAIPDYQTSLNMMHSAESLFMEVPAVLRERFGNDAGKFLRFCSNPKNEDELIRMGLAVAKPQPEGAGSSAPKGGASLEDLELVPSPPEAPGAPSDGASAPSRKAKPSQSASARRGS